MRTRILWKLLAIHLAVTTVIVGLLWFSLDYLAAEYFRTLSTRYGIPVAKIQEMFLEAAHRALLVAGLIASGLGVLFSALLNRSILVPLSHMIAASRKISAGDYGARVPPVRGDELGTLSTALNEMASHLQRMEEIRRTLLANVAHELRTPLTNMRGYIEALHDGVVAPSAEVFKSLHDETLRLVKLVADLMQLARAEAARQTLEQNDLRLGELVGQCLDLFRPRFAAKGIEATVDTGIGGSVTADRDKIVQAVSNLLENALDFTPSGGRVRVVVERLVTTVKVLVENTGSSIAEQDVPRIFDRFYRSEPSRVRGDGGAGLGLAIVKELIDAHGGQVGVESSQDRTRVWFTLPV